jgi:hypothetical protein
VDDLSGPSSDFRNLGQFVAAVNVSEHLDIPFADLKKRMVDQNMSLGQAIHDLKPGVDADTEAANAEHEAEAEIRR